MNKQTPDIPNTITKIAAIFSWPVIASINIGISGYLWGEILSLSKEGKDYFNIPIPPFFRFKISGQQVIAGFTAFTISLLVVGLLCHEIASNIFIRNLEITKDKKIACNLLATSLSVTSSILILGIKVIFNYYSVIKKYYKESDRLIVQTLTTATKEDEFDDNE